MFLLFVLVLTGVFVAWVGTSTLGFSLIYACFFIFIFYVLVLLDIDLCRMNSFFYWTCAPRACRWLKVVVTRMESWLVIAVSNVLLSEIGGSCNDKSKSKLWKGHSCCETTKIETNRRWKRRHNLISELLSFSVFTSGDEKKKKVRQKKEDDKEWEKSIEKNN